MTPGLLSVLLALPVLLLGSALFSACETAFSTFQPVRLKDLEKTNPGLASGLRKLLAEPRRLSSALVFADAMVNLPLILACLFLIREVLQTPLPHWVTTLVIFTVLVFLGDLLPKLLALVAPLPFARAGLVTFRFIFPIISPVTETLTRATEKLTELVLPRRMRQRVNLSEDELETLFDLSEEMGALEEFETEIIREIIKLNDKTVRDIMVPRVDTFALPDDLTNDEAIRQLRDHRFRQVLIYGENRDDVLGVLNVRDFLLAPDQPYTETMATPSFVPETMRAMDLLRNFLKHPQGMAVIVDEFGGFEGIATFANISEEILSDAVPTAGHAAEIQEIGPNRWLVHASARLEDLREELGVEIEMDGVDTIGGLIFHTVESIPTAGTRVKIGKLNCVVRRNVGKRIDQLLVSIDNPSAGEVEA